MNASGRLYEVFLVLPNFRHQSREFSAAVRPLDNRDDFRPVSIQAYYNPRDDEAIVALLYSQSKVGLTKIAWLGNFARDAHIEIVDPRNFSASQRHGFYEYRLGNASLHVSRAKSIETATEELFGLLTDPFGFKAAGIGDITGLGDDDLEEELGYTARGTDMVDDLISKIQPVDDPLALGTPSPDERLETNEQPEFHSIASPSLEQLAAVHELMTDAPSEAQAAFATDDRYFATPKVDTESSEVSSFASAEHMRAEAERLRAEQARPSPGSYVRGRKKGESYEPDVVVVDMSRANAARRIAEQRITPKRPVQQGKRPIVRDRRDRTTAVERPNPQLAAGSTVQRDFLRVRFLRGDAWEHGQLRYISNKSAKIATGALPRAGDSLAINLHFRDKDLVVPGIVANVVSAVDTPEDGSTGFEMQFRGLSGDLKTRLLELLKLARDARIALHPPHPRSAQRFPVSWPFVVDIGAGPTRAQASDISLGGMFLQLPGGHVGQEFSFMLPLDTTGPAIEGRGRLVREVTDSVGASRGIAPGFGAQIISFSPGDQQRYAEFLDRIRLRTERRLLIAAAPGRIDELARGLRAAGYAVTTSTDPSTLATLAANEPRPPDMAIVDESLIAAQLESATLRDVLRQRRVPCLATRGERVERARRVIDHLLRVGNAPT